MLLADAIEAWGLNGTHLDPSETKTVRRIWATLRTSKAAAFHLESMTADNTRAVMALFDPADAAEVAKILNSVRDWALGRRSGAPVTRPVATQPPTAAPRPDRSSDFAAGPHWLTPREAPRADPRPPTPRRTLNMGPQWLITPGTPTTPTSRPPAVEGAPRSSPQPTPGGDAWARPPQGGAFSSIGLTPTPSETEWLAGAPTRSETAEPVASMSLTAAIAAWLGREDGSFDHSENEKARRFLSTLRSSTAGSLDIGAMSRDDAQTVMALFDDDEQYDAAAILNSVRAWFLAKQTRDAGDNSTFAAAISPGGPPDRPAPPADFTVAAAISPDRPATSLNVDPPLDIPLPAERNVAATSIPRPGRTDHRSWRTVVRSWQAGVLVAFLIVLGVGIYLVSTGGDDQSDTVVLVAPDPTASPAPSTPPPATTVPLPPVVRPTAIPLPTPTTAVTPTPTATPTPVADSLPAPVSAGPAAPTPTSAPDSTPATPAPDDTSACATGEGPASGTRYRVDGLPSSTGGAPSRLVVRSSPSDSAPAVDALAADQSGLVFDRCAVSSSGLRWWRLTGGGWVVSFFLTPM